MLTLLAAPAPAQESADERYQFLAGLCEAREFELAVNEARAFLGEHPRHPKSSLARYRLATALYELGRRDEARLELVELSKLAQFEFAAEVAFRLGQCELAADRADAAASAFERALRSQAAYLHAPAAFFLGEARSRQGRFDDAEAAYARVAADSEYALEARAGVAWCAHRRGQHDRAAQLASSFLAEHRDHAVADEMCFVLGESTLALGNPRDALEAFGAVRGGEFRESALRGAAFAHAELGDHAAAARAFGRVLEQFPEGRHAAEAALQRGIELLRAGDAAGAARALRAPQVGDGAEARAWRARALLDAGDAAAALRESDAALASEVNDELRARLQVTRGDALTALGRGAEASQAYAGAKSETGLYAAAIAAHNAGRHAEAGPLALSLLRDFPRSAHAAQMQLVLAESAFATQRYDEAERAFTAALAAAQDDAARSRATARIAWCSYLRDDFGAAQRLFAEAFELDSAAKEADETLYMRGLAAERAGDKSAAAAAWREHAQRFEHSAKRSDALLGLARVDDDSQRWLELLAREAPEGGAAAAVTFELAERAAKSGRRDEALARYRELLQRFPEHELAANARYGLAFAAYEAGRFDEAARELAAVDSASPASDSVALAAAELTVFVATKRNDPDAALRACRRLLASSAPDARKLAALRSTTKALGAGRTNDAQAMFDELLASAADESVVREILIENAWLALDSLRPDDAEAAVRIALKYGLDETTKPKLAEASFFTGEARYAANDDPRAVELYRIAAQHGSADIAARALYKEGFAHLRANALDEAGRCFGVVVERHAKHELAAECLYLQGETHFRAGRYEQALASLEQFRRDAPKHAALDKALFRTGLANGELGRWEACAAALGELVKRNPKFEQLAEAELWRGRAQAKSGDARGARATFERLVASDKSVIAARARIALGVLASEAGEHERALADFLKVALLYANPAEVAEATWRAGGELEALGQVERARERYREVVAKHADTEFARRAERRLSELDAR